MVPGRRSTVGDLALPRDVEAWTTIGMPETRALVPQVLDWLRARDPEQLLRTVDGWPPATRLALRHVLITQGLAPLVADVLARPVADGLAVPAGARDTVTWLAEQIALSRTRAARFADDLRAILARAAAAGVAVMPLKGGVIAFTHYHEAGLRPMADLDLLVRADDEAGLHDVVMGLGYRRVTGTVDGNTTFRRPDDRIVALSTHPDNPRPVEVHTRLRRSVWIDRGGIDVAPHLWASARAASLLGQPVLVPDETALFVAVASHAMGHLVRGAGRVLQWVDVAMLAAGGAVRDDDEALLDGDAARWVYPPLALAARAFPNDRSAAHVARLAPAVGTNLMRFAACVPLDDRAGLNLRGVHEGRLGWLHSRWHRWKPNPWLVRLVHPDAPYPLAYGGYVAGVAARSVQRTLQRGARRDG